MAALALLVALGSAALSWRALDQAQTARDIASARQPAGSTSTGPGTLPSSTPGAADPPQTPTATEEPPRSPGTPPELSEQTVYEPKYENQSLTLKPTDCFKEMEVDLDEPRANVGANTSDLALNAGCPGAPFIRMANGVEGSEAATAGMKPAECNNAIRSAPVAAEAEVPLRKGSWLCIRTNYAAAREQRDRWRMVLLEVVTINNDRTTVIRVTAWNIPED
ncbi:hypothetical protein [Micromonospora sp. WMMD710]|uniref:hypothetical protein n=1 Tax=Micromonospora sp. WMMD710 TaxID=3016085 RepID=UPI002415C885|nr:hypothetical protein [Micromonospora sp. WMMD710]MDG4758726.1 hypothetical protein [Micromonospora sp. WMMD710]